MTIDKEKLKGLLWAESASWRADCADWKLHTEALADFLGERTLEEVALELLAENERLEVDSGSLRGSTKRMGEDVSKMQKQMRKLQREVERFKAENERLQEAHEQICTNYNQVSYASEERGKQIDQLKAENEALRKAAGQVLSWIEAKHRPPVADQLETGRMALVRLHALADLDAAMGKGEQS